MKQIFPYNKQHIDQDDIDAVVKSLTGDFLTTGPISAQLEQAIASYVGSQYAIVCSNGTAALFLAMQALELKSEEAVLTTPITFVADANCARNLGAQVYFADVNPETINLCVNETRKVLEKRKEIKIVIPVHFAGYPLDLCAFDELAKEFNVTIVDDACHAFGGSYVDKSGKILKIGNGKHSKMTIFSFHPIKNITTGEGGAITTNDKKLYEKLVELRRHGIVNEPSKMINKEMAFTKIDGKEVSNPWYYEMQNLSCNYRITEPQCALGLSQLKKIDTFISKRNLLADHYQVAIGKYVKDIVKPLKKIEQGIHGYHLFVIQMEMKNLKGGRAALMLELQRSGIFTQVHYIPIHLQPYYQNHFKVRQKFEVAENYYENCLSLPLFVQMNEQDPDFIIQKLSQAIELLRRNS